MGLVLGGIIWQPDMALDFDIDNSSAQGILSFGGFAFPILSSCSRPDLTIQIRDAAGDREVYREVTQATGSRNVYVNGLDGVNFDQGGSGYSSNPPGDNVTSFCSHGRWITNAGIARTVSRTTQIRVLNDAGTAVIETWVVPITARFTG